MKTDMTANEVRTVLDYSPDTGAFSWKVQRSHRLTAGSKAGTVAAHGYIHIVFQRRVYKGHRLAWLIMTGEWPDGMIDHINGVKHDNRFCNLRLATRIENCQNAKLSKHNTSGLKGASFHKGTGKWCSVIRVSGKQRWLGLFESAEDAHAAYMREARHNFGTFARAM